ncbi:hypothetical protein LB505_008504 [Fusarium chuoi]|nr:hypothetical protein LB505_008504 [Fusarium chuoi]
MSLSARLAWRATTRCTARSIPALVRSAPRPTIASTPRCLFFTKAQSWLDHKPQQKKLEENTPGYQAVTPCYRPARRHLHAAQHINLHTSRRCPGHWLPRSSRSARMGSWPLCLCGRNRSPRWMDCASLGQQDSRGHSH